MQMDMVGSTDFIGWGTAKGVGVDDCPDDFTGWNIYIDGIRNNGLTYFCRQNFGQLSMGAFGDVFSFAYGNCDGEVRWRAKVNSEQLTCQAVDGISGDHSAGSESIGTTATQDLRMDYQDVEYKTTTTDWASWSGQWFECDDPGYDVTNFYNYWHRVILE